ncbi:MAG: insulinase family protein [Defluviitaleaceae bacterium]|nr:insulinase family protein [Defluviitaleaceae bacterium]MCL2836501.1 insulinase family protein [Defluviitaleaceae bacterium]
MKRFIAILLVISMMMTGCISYLGGVGAAAAAPAGGHGFTVSETGSIDLIGVETTVYTHGKTGARVIHLGSDDKNRSLLIGFETPTIDNTGLPHILEHMSLGGSDKYPSPQIFFALIYQTYNTWMNANVFNSATLYHYASMSEDQLLLMSDFFMDAVFHPLLYADDLAFRREAWHYKLDDADAPLNIGGIVYNEMKGAIDINWQASQNMLNTLYPGSVAANNAGGVPEDILSLTYEDVVAYHQTYYHPSNMTVFLYGDLDIEPFLAVIGEYADLFEKQEIYVDKGIVPAFTEPVAAVFRFPMESTAQVENNAIIYYAVNLGQLSTEPFGAFGLLASVLNEEASPVKTKLREALPTANVSVSFEYTTAGENLSVVGRGLNESDADLFKSTVDAAIFEILAEGLDLELLEASIASNEFWMLYMSEMPNLGINLSMYMAWLSSTSPERINYFNDSIAALETMKNEYRNRYFENLIEEYIVNNPHTVLVVTVPAPGMQEELDARLRAELDALKERMTDGEINEILEQNAIFAAVMAEEAPVWMIESLNAVTVDNLPVEVRNYEVTEKEIGGVRAFTAEMSAGGINVTAVEYNAAAVTVEELHYLNLYAHLMGRVRTENYDLNTLQTKNARYLNNFGAAAFMQEFYDFSYLPVFSVQWMGLNDDQATAAALVAEMVTKTDLTDTDTIAGLLGRLRSSLRNQINNSIINVMYTRALANRYESYAYIDYMRGVEYFNFVNEAIELIENDPAAFTANLEAVRDKLVYLDGTVAVFVGNAEGVAAFEENLGFLTAHLREGAVPAADLSNIPRPADSEGLIIDATVQSNMFFAASEEIGLEFSGKLLPMGAIIDDAYLIPEVRYNLGAYGVFFVPSRHGIGTISFRDATVTETFAVYEAMADFIASLELEQSDIDRYIISTFSNETMPLGEISDALVSIYNVYQGFPEDYKLNMLHEMKTLTAADITAFAEYIAKAAETGLRSTAGGQSAILAHAELFDEIVYAFGVPGEGDEPQVLSRLDALQALFGEADGLYGYLVGEGIVLDIASPDDPMTREEFAYILAAALGWIPYDGEDAEIADAGDISEYAYRAVMATVFSGIFPLDGDGSFGPQEGVTFEYAMTVIGSLY